MGKRQHQKDKMYLTYTEWKSYGGYKPTNAEEENVKFKRLPFDHCCLTMVPFEHPYCDQVRSIIFPILLLLSIPLKFLPRRATSTNCKPSWTFCNTSRSIPSLANPWKPSP